MKQQHFQVMSQGKIIFLFDPESKKRITLPIGYHPDIKVLSAFDASGSIEFFDGWERFLAYAGNYEDLEADDIITLKIKNPSKVFRLKFEQMGYEDIMSVLKELIFRTITIE